MNKEHRFTEILLLCCVLFFCTHCTSKADSFFDKYEALVSGWEKKTSNGKLSVLESHIMYDEIETLEHRNTKIWQDNSNWSELELIRWNQLTERKSKLLGW